jgi:hypothetical protein
MMFFEQLKRYILVILFIISGLMLNAKNFDSYKSAEFAIPQAPQIINAGFESGTKGWKLPDGYGIDRKGGRNGLACLTYTRQDAKKYCLGQTTIKVNPDTRYHYGVWIRCSNVKGARSGATMCLEYFKKGKWVGGDYPEGIKGTRDWTFLSSNATIPQGVTECRLSLYFRKGITGKAWFDDVSIKTVVPRLSIDTVAPAFETITPENGNVRINIYYESVWMRNKIDSMKLNVKFKSKNKLKSITVPIKNHSALLNLSGLTEGKTDLNVTLFDPERKIILGRKTLPLNVVSANRSVPENACKIDRLGRSVINNKPYMPVGLYVQNLHKEDLDRIANSPFNCVMPYQSLDLRLSRKIPKSIKAIKETLDYCNSKNLKVIFSLKDEYKGMANSKKHWCGVNGAKNIVTKAINAFKSHPALLAWYINDEQPKSMIDRLIARRRLVNKLDPFHPTWAVLCKFGELPLYSSACDVMGVDSYPVVNNKTQDMLNNAKGMVASDLTGLPVWGVPQIMNWGNYEAKGHTKTFKKNYRDPSEAEMLSMALFFALRGVKGFVFYSYFDLKRPLDPKRFNPPAYTQQYFDKRWREICNVGKVIRSLEPFLLSEKPSRPVKMLVKRGKVQAREFQDKKGNVCIIITGLGPGKACAFIQSNTNLQLKSVYGNSVNIRKNIYRFTGDNICSDILISKK